MAKVSCAISLASSNLEASARCCMRHDVLPGVCNDITVKGSHPRSNSQSSVRPDRSNRLHVTHSLPERESPEPTLMSAVTSGRVALAVHRFDPRDKNVEGKEMCNCCRTWRFHDREIAA